MNYPLNKWLFKIKFVMKKNRMLYFGKSPQIPLRVAVFVPSQAVGVCNEGRQWMEGELPWLQAVKGKELRWGASQMGDENSPDWEQESPWEGMEKVARKLFCSF